MMLSIQSKSLEKEFWLFVTKAQTVELEKIGYVFQIRLYNVQFKLNMLSEHVRHLFSNRCLRSDENDEKMQMMWRVFWQ